jgi:hypothetical protein
VYSAWERQKRQKTLMQVETNALQKPVGARQIGKDQETSQTSQEKPAIRQ